MKIKALLAVLLAAGLTLAGCWKADINVDTAGLTGGGGDGGPSQLPASNGGGWQDILYGVGGHMIGAERGMLYYAYDTLAYPRAAVDLTVRLRTLKLQAVPGVTIGFYDGDRLLAQARTASDGHASVSWTPPEPGVYRLQAKVIAVDDEDNSELLKLSPAPLVVAAHRKDAKLLVIDLDHTVVDSSFVRALALGGQPMGASVDVTKRLAKRYGIVYLTHRPDLLTRKSKSFLTGKGYPAGPLLVSELKDLADSGKFKSAKLGALTQVFPEVRIGIGDKLSDAQAYVDNGLTAYLIPDYDREPEDMRKMAREISRLRGRGRLHVVSGWKEIEASVFRGVNYPPENFVAYLRREAELLEARERRRERDDDDDYDDDDDD